MTSEARWTLLTSTAAPVALIGGWLVAAAVQPPGSYDAARQTISVLAGQGAVHRWVMTAGLLAVGICNTATAIGLPTLRLISRTVLGLAGLTGVGVALAPQPAHGSSATHIALATASLTLLALWPMTVGRARWHGSLVLGRGSSAVAASCCIGLLLWVLAAGHGVGGLGVAERVATGVENLWPLSVVLALRHRAGKMTA